MRTKLAVFSLLCRTCIFLPLTLGFAASSNAASPQLPDTGWGDTLVKLAQVGFIGAAIALFLLGAAVLIWGRERNPSEATTIRLYLLFAFLSVVLAAGIHIWDTWNARMPGTVIISFSPDFKDQGLPDPRIYTSQGDKRPGDVIDVSKDRMLMIYVDNLINAVKKLQTSVATAKKSTQATQKVLAKYAQNLAKQAGDPVVDPTAAQGEPK